MRKFANDVDLAIYAVCTYARTLSRAASIAEEDLYVIMEDLGAPAYISSIIEELIERHLIRQTSTGYSSAYAVAPKSYSYVERKLEEEDSFLAQHIGGSGDDADLQRVEKEADDVWEPLPINREVPEYSEAVEAIGEAIETVEKDNGYPTSDPEERDQILGSLKAGLQWIQEGAPSLAQIRATVLAPLRFLAAKFSGAAMGEAAKVAVAALAKWPGLGS